MYSVRGKRRKSAISSDKDSAPRRKPGRPMKRASELAAPKKFTKAQLQQMRQQAVTAESPSEPQLSSLERLPNELIQQIFFDCFEVNLPRASLRLAQALSTESTYNALVLFAYFDDNGYPVETRLFLPAIYRRLALHVKARLQEEILSCRWLTSRRIAKCIPVLSRLTMVQAWHKEQVEEEIHLNLLKAMTDADMDLHIDESALLYGRPFASNLKDLASLPKLEDTEALIKHFFAKEATAPKPRELEGVPSVAWNSEGYLPRIVRWKSSIWAEQSARPAIWTKFPSDSVRILFVQALPDWLLRGNPWSKEALDLLQMLRQGSLFRSDTIWPPLQVSAAAVFDGMVSAIEEMNATALLTLVELHNDLLRSVKVCESVPRPKHFYAIPPRVFHAATRIGAESSAFMWLLIRAGLEDIYTDDHVLTAWALEKRAEGDDIAEFLLDFMSSALGPCRDRFVGGRLDAFWTSHPPLPADHSFGEELGYLHRFR